MSNEWQKDRESCDAASEGPWEWDGVGEPGKWFGDPSMPPGALVHPYGPPDEDGTIACNHILWGRWDEGGECLTGRVVDVDFIARARTRWPAALDEIERLRKENERLSEWGNALSQALSDTAAELADAKRRLGEGVEDLLAAVEEAKRGLAYHQDSHNPGAPEPPMPRFRSSTDSCGGSR